MKFNFFNLTLLVAASYVISLVLMLSGVPMILICLFAFTLGLFWDVITGRPIAELKKDSGDKK